MLAVGVLLIGAGLSLALAAPAYEFGFGQGNFLAVGVAVVQILVAGALTLRVPGAWLLAMGAFAVHLIALILFGAIYLVFTVLPSAGGGPFTGNEFNPVGLGAVLAAASGILLVYAAAIRETLALRRTT